MSLFESAKVAKTQDIEVTFAPTSDGWNTLVVNGVAYGAVRKGTTPDQDAILVNSALSEHQKVEALVSLAVALAENDPQRVCRAIGESRKLNQKK